ncbi:Uncharacterised protein [Delftia tsuruhatensis]|uniref:cysteine-rich CWC family protein n=1 Tax=Delftia tsuruhatensis TaxID=180282 RepID=UPI001E6C3C8F|nr:cysteine-rich CWC family protein [Delftia tsuruhatensis]CAB5720928.1 Uncharacterised protein [Delftia tsuruhatensis]CAC9693768.1 Uncharacterised protein [Delftia tsuruhatensis]
MTKPPLDASLCPLCGRSNRCAVMEGGDPGGCWCMDAPISPDALARIPQDARDLACLCPTCAALAATETPPLPRTQGEKWGSGVSSASLPGPI